MLGVHISSRTGIFGGGGGRGHLFSENSVLVYVPATRGAGDAFGLDPVVSMLSLHQGGRWCQCNSVLWTESLLNLLENFHQTKRYNCIYHWVMLKS